VADRDLLPLLEQRLRGRFAPTLADTDATILLTASAQRQWTIIIDRGRLTARRGSPIRPTTTITATFEVLAAVISGERSGIEAFLAAALIVRGNVALSLQLDGLFVDAQRAVDPPTRADAVSADGIETFYLQAGDPGAPTVVLVHGLGATNASMLPLVMSLAPNYHVLAPDLPGHGATAAAKDSYGANFLGHWLATFIQVTGGDKPAVVVGNSLGGRVAIEAALLSPELVRGLVLLCPAVAFRRLRQFVPLVRLMRPELARLRIRVPRRAALRGLRSLFADPSRLPAVWYDAAIDEFARMVGTRRGRVAFFSALRQIYLDEPFGEHGFWERLPGLLPPALFVWGDRDILVPAGFARYVDEALPDVQTVILDDCGHVPQFEHRERTVELVDAFLSGLPEDAARSD